MQSTEPPLAAMRIAYDENIDTDQYPFSVPLIANLEEITFTVPVTFFVGENGSGKSTILETIAQLAGFGHEGGSKNIRFTTSNETYKSGIDQLALQARLSWRKKVFGGYFFRAESYFAVGNYLDNLAKQPFVTRESVFAPYGGLSPHEQSHGEGFLQFFTNRVQQSGLYILDEPEAALSPQRQLALLRVLHDTTKNPDTQFIIATHSPILLAYPGATIYSCDGDTLNTIAYTDTEHYQITKNFLDNPQVFLHHLFS